MAVDVHGGSRGHERVVGGRLPGGLAEVVDEEGEKPALVLGLERVGEGVATAAEHERCVFCALDDDLGLGALVVCKDHAAEMAAVVLGEGDGRVGLLRGLIAASCKQDGRESRSAGGRGGLQHLLLHRHCTLLIWLAESFGEKSNRTTFSNDAFENADGSPDKKTAR